MRDDLEVLAALGYYHYVDLDPDRTAPDVIADNPGNFAGNQLDPTGTRFASDFRIVNPFVAVTWSGWDAHPITLAGEFIHNAGAAGDEDDIGWALGASVKGSVLDRPATAYYQWHVVERDAVFAAFAQDDHLFQTNHRSHVTGLKVKLADQIGLHLWALFSARDETTPGAENADSDKTQTRLRADLNVKF